MRMLKFFEYSMQYFGQRQCMLIEVGLHLYLWE